MGFPKLPDWMIYAALVAGLTLTAASRREHADAPPAPPPPDAREGALLGTGGPFDPLAQVDAAPPPGGPISGTAFAVSQTGVWMTARHVVEACAEAAVIVAPGRGVLARVTSAPLSDTAVLNTEGGPTALPVAFDADLKPGDRAFHAGFPRGRPGEVATRLIGPETLRARGRGRRAEPVLAWAEVGRTWDLRGGLAGLSGAPALDEQGRVVAVTVAQAPRRGRVYTTDPSRLDDTFDQRLRGEFAPGAPVTVQNYGRVADALRRDLRVAQVVCLTPV